MAASPSFVSFCCLSTFAFFVCLLNLHASLVHAQAPAPSPTSDGSAIDLGVAYALMFVALAVTYLMHPVDGFPFNLF